ncbi:MAG: hypothetical protein ABIK28_25765 [Planctomycetota bacterium]
MKNGKVEEHLGREAFHGFACLDGVEFENGVIEMDVAVDGSRSYPGLVFRMQSEETYERFYIRPHRAGLYPDALQYTPVFHGDSPWQLYSGEGYTAGANLPVGRWFHLKMEIKGNQARVFVDGDGQPALEIHDLKHGTSRGTIGVYGPPDQSAFFSDFRYAVDESLEFEAPPHEEMHEGTLVDWEISNGFPEKAIDREAYPSFPLFHSAKWTKVRSEANGLVNITRHVKRENREGDLVFAKTVFISGKRQTLKLWIGYSDKVTVFHNGKPVFAGNSAYRSRDPSFAGYIGFHDALFLDLQEGLNEIFMTVSETFGGWGVMARADMALDAPVREHERAVKQWETAADFLTPESVQYDPKREILYVTSFDVDFSRKSEPSGFISKVKLNGEVEELRWVTGLRGPCGMALYKDSLYVAERGALTVIDVTTGEVIDRHAMPGTVFINDVAVDGSGQVYVSDSFRTTPGRSTTIYRLRNGKVEPWIDDERLNRTNGLFVDNGFLYVGNTGDCTLKAIGLLNREIHTVACLGAGIVDGIRATRSSDHVVTLWEGKVFLVSPKGNIVEVLDLIPEGLNCADIEFIKEKDLLIVPTFYGNKLMAYTITSH